MCEVLEETGWSILNGNVEGDEEGEWTYTRGGGESAIHYVLENKEMRMKVRRIRMWERVNSDHQPITVWIKERRRGGVRRKSRKKEKRKRGSGRRRKRFDDYFGKMKVEGDEVEEGWARLRKRVE